MSKFMVVEMVCAVAFAVGFVALGADGSGADPRANAAEHAAQAAGGTAEVAGWTEANPFAKASTLPFQAPPFDKIKDSDYQPAIEEGIRRELIEVEAVANNPEPPTFANTIEALERRGELLTRVGNVFGNLTSANTNPTLQKIDTDTTPKIAAMNDAIYLNPKLFARVKAVYDGREAAGLQGEAKYLTERYYRDFVRAGANLSEADKEKMRGYNKELALLANQFQNKLLAATNAAGVLVDNKAALAGLSDADITHAADAATAAGHPGKWLITLQNTTQQPPQVYLKNRAVRERLFNASVERASHADHNDTQATIERQAQLRAQRAKLLGYPNYASYALETQMAKTPDNAFKLLTDLSPAATAKARGEAARMQNLIDEQKGGFKLEPWDWQFYAEQVRKSDYALDESQIKPYLEIDRVLQDGVFFAAHQMYGLTFEERKDIPVYQQDVRVFEVFDADGSSLALFYFDPWARPNKIGGAWTNAFVGESTLLKQKAVVTNTENFSKPPAGQPALVSFSDVITMFHEFGHALHGMLNLAAYPSSDVPRDFVEMPSQFNEHWALEPTVFANYAKHYKTGEPMPDELVAKIRKARTFNQGFATTEYVEASLLDLAWHTLPPDAPLQDAAKFDPEALEKYKVYMKDVPPRYHSPYFAHIWSGGYSSGYYAYLWAEVIDDDAYEWFVENGGMTRANGQRFREMILAKAGTEDAAEMYRAFRGRDASVTPLIEQRGLSEHASARVR